MLIDITEIESYMIVVAIEIILVGNDEFRS